MGMTSYTEVTVCPGCSKDMKREEEEGALTSQQYRWIRAPLPFPLCDFNQPPVASLYCWKEGGKDGVVDLKESSPWPARD